MDPAGDIYLGAEVSHLGLKVEGCLLPCGVAGGTKGGELLCMACPDMGCCPDSAWVSMEEKCGLLAGDECLFAMALTPECVAVAVECERLADWSLGVEGECGCATKDVHGASPLLLGKVVVAPSAEEFGPVVSPVAASEEVRCAAKPLKCLGAVALVQRYFGMEEADVALMDKLFVALVCLVGAC